MAKRLISMRLEPELLDRVDRYARRHGWTEALQDLRGGDHRGRDAGRTQITEHLYRALVEDRLLVLPPSHHNAFPADQCPAGSSPEHPLMVCFDSTPTTEETP
jgi:hypothetical protein